MSPSALVFSISEDGIPNVLLGQTLRTLDNRKESLNIVRAILRKFEEDKDAYSYQARFRFLEIKVLHVLYYDSELVKLRHLLERYPATTPDTVVKQLLNKEGLKLYRDWKRNEFAPVNNRYDVSKGKLERLYKSWCFMGDWDTVNLAYYPDSSDVQAMLKYGFQKIDALGPKVRTWRNMKDRIGGTSQERLVQHFCFTIKQLKKEISTEVERMVDTFKKSDESDEDNILELRAMVVELRDVYCISLRYDNIWEMIEEMPITKEVRFDI